MNLNRIFSVPKTKPKNSLSEINTAESYFIVHEKLDGSKEVKYHVNLIDLLDKAFLNNIQDFLSVEQDRFMDKFYKAAGEITDKINKADTNPYEKIDMVLLQLDDFLGGYIGEDNGKYTR